MKWDRERERVKSPRDEERQLIVNPERRIEHKE